MLPGVCDRGRLALPAGHALGQTVWCSKDQLHPCALLAQQVSQRSMHTIPPSPPPPPLPSLPLVPSLPQTHTLVPQIRQPVSVGQTTAISKLVGQQHHSSG